MPPLTSKARLLAEPGHRRTQALGAFAKQIGELLEPSPIQQAILQAAGQSQVQHLAGQRPISGAISQAVFDLMGREIKTEAQFERAMQLLTGQARLKSAELRPLKPEKKQTLSEMWAAARKEAIAATEKIPAKARTPLTVILDAVKGFSIKAGDKATAMRQVERELGPLARAGKDQEFWDTAADLLKDLQVSNDADRDIAIGALTSMLQFRKVGAGGVKGFFGGEKPRTVPAF